MQRLRLLILSNYYPPDRSWGYTQLCHEVTERLSARGHELFILTSNSSKPGASEEQGRIFRELYLESEPEFYSPRTFFTRRRSCLRHNLKVLEQLVHRLQPDAIFIWGLWNTTHHLPAHAERLGSPPTVYYISDQWPVTSSPHESYWSLPARRWYMSPVKWALALLAKVILTLEGKPPPLEFKHAMCVSRSLRESLISQNVPLSEAQIVYNGVDLETFASRKPNEGRPSGGEALRLLVAGRLTRDKGVHTALEALALLVQSGVQTVHLTIVGDGRLDYIQFLRKIVRRNALKSYVTFKSRVEREEMPGLLRQFDALVFPSLAMEALPRMPQEAMASGLLVIGTTIGGTGELLVEGETGLTFPPEDSAELAQQVQRVLSEPEAASSMAARGYQRVVEQFNLERMVDEIEQFLLQVTAGAALR